MRDEQVPASPVPGRFSARKGACARAVGDGFAASVFPVASVLSGVSVAAVAPVASAQRFSCPHGQEQPRGEFGRRRLPALPRETIDVFAALSGAAHARRVRIDGPRGKPMARERGCSSKVVAPSRVAPPRAVLVPVLVACRRAALAKAVTQGRRQRFALRAGTSE